MAKVPEEGEVVVVEEEEEEEGMVRRARYLGRSSAVEEGGREEGEEEEGMTLQPSTRSIKWLGKVVKSTNRLWSRFKAG